MLNLDYVSLFCSRLSIALGWPGKMFQKRFYHFFIPKKTNSNFKKNHFMPIKVNPPPSPKHLTYCCNYFLFFCNPVEFVKEILK